jgi:hypothetical protein
MQVLVTDGATLVEDDRRGIDLDIPAGCDLAGTVEPVAIPPGFPAGCHQVE